MKLKVGYKWKSIDGISKGKQFTIVSLSNSTVEYKSDESGTVYESSRKHFEKYIERVHKHWNQTLKQYKSKKAELKGS